MASNLRTDFERAISRSPMLAPPSAISDTELAVVVANHVEWRASNKAGGAQAILVNRELAGKNLGGMNLALARLELCDLRTVSFEKADITGTSFAGSDLGRANFSDCQGAGAVFLSCHCEESSFHRAALGRASFMFASLHRTDFLLATLDYADFEGANLREANFQRARLAGVELEHWFLTEKQVEGAHGDANTKLPKGIFLPGMPSKAKDDDKSIREAGKWTPLRCAYWRSLPEDQRRPFEEWVFNQPRNNQGPQLPPGADNG